MRSSKTLRKFLAVWCSEGLETLYDLTELEQEQEQWEKEATWRILKEEVLANKPTGPRLQTILLRARYNSHRQYEVYIFTTDCLDKKAVEGAFDSSPQFMADFIRKNGSKIYSDYVPRDRQKIQ